MRPLAFAYLWVLPTTLCCSEFVERNNDDVAEQGTCVASCPTPGQVECDGATGRRVCVEVDGCASWRPAEACDAGTECRAGECGNDQCPADGTLTCAGNSGLQRCELGAQGFLDWGNFQGCDEGLVCDEGACVTPAEGCPALGKRLCGAEGVSVCKLVKGRLAWTAEACGPGTSCRGAGVCGVDACTSGAQRCDGDLIAACTDDPNGFKVFAPAAACPDGAVCRDLALPFAPPKAQCGVDVCVADALRCAPAPERCAPDASGFLDWRAEPNCAEGLECREGLCGADACPAAGVTECVVDGLRVCASVGGFLAWSAPAACVDAVCVAGACVQNGCPGVGATQCADETHASLCKADEQSGLLSWGPPVPCPGQGSVCRVQGVCGKDACPVAGAVQCTDDSSTAICQFGGGPFLVWGPGESCDPSDECRAGYCGHDECVLGSAECLGDATRRVCVDGAASGATPGFGVWGPELGCEHPDQTCGDGQCSFGGSFELLPSAASASVAAVVGGGFGVFSGETLAWRTYGADGLLESVAELGLQGQGVRATALASGAFGLWFDPTGGLSAASLSPPGAAFALPAVFPLSTLLPAHLFASAEGPYAVRVEGTDTGDRIVGSPLSASGALYTVEIASNDAPVSHLGAAPTASGAAAFAWTTSSDPATLLTRRLNLTGGTVTPVLSIPTGLPVVGLALACQGEAGVVVVEQQGALSVSGINFDDNVFNGAWSPVVLGERPVLVGDALLYRVKAGPSEQQLWMTRVGPAGLLTAPMLVDVGASVQGAHVAQLGPSRWVVVYLRDGALRARFEEGEP